MQADLFGRAPLPVAELDDRQRFSCLRLIRSENVGPVTFRTLINHFGGAEQALDALPELARRGGNRRGIRICPPEDVAAELAAAARTNAKPIFTIEAGFPRALAVLPSPPPMLYIKGKQSWLQGAMIGVVGSRAASASGIELTRRLASDLGEKGFVIASGLARGIDAAAHKASMATGTVAVLAGGIDVVYPPEHARLQAEIGEVGCLVSELPPGFQPRGADFPRRNRIIAGVSLGVLVVEAAARSGSLITARLAAEQGREVFAVPGHPLDPRAEGTNGLLKQGATLVTEANDIVHALKGMLGEGPRFHSGSFMREIEHPAGGDLAFADATSAVGGGAGVDGRAADVDAEPENRQRHVVLQALGPAPVDTNALVRATGLSARIVQMALIELALAGRIEHHGANLVSLKPSLPS